MKTPPLSRPTAFPEYHPYGGQLNKPSTPGGTPIRRSWLRWPSPVQLYACALGVAAIVTFAAVVGTASLSIAPFWAIGALAAMAIVAEKQSVRIGPNTEMSVAALPILFAAVVYGPYAAMLVAGGSVLVDFGKPHARWIIWTSSRALTGAAAGLAAHAILVAQGSRFGGVLLAVGIAALTEAFCDVLLNSATVMVRRSGSLRSTMWPMARLFLRALPFYVPMVAALVYAYQEVSPWTVAFFAVPALAAQSLLVLYQNQRDLTERMIAANVRLEEASLSFAGGLVAALDARDHYTAGHSATVAIYTKDIARRLGLSSREQQLAHLSGLLHDVGKVGLPPGILEKAGPLTAEERREMEEHSAIGERILRSVDDYGEIATIVRHHHERVDGTGYPDGLRADEIPLLSRVVAVADAYAAMTSARSYRDALPVWVARERLKKGTGTQFDAMIVAIFDSLLDELSTSDLLEHGSDQKLAARPIEQLVAMAAGGS